MRMIFFLSCSTCTRSRGCDKEGPRSDDWKKIILARKISNIRKRLFLYAVADTDLGEENHLDSYFNKSSKKKMYDQLMPFNSAMVVSINASERGQSDRRQSNDHQQEIDQLLFALLLYNTFPLSLPTSPLRSN